MPGENLFRQIDGSHNNPDKPLMGAAFTPLVRLLPDDYGDGISSLAGEQRRSAREISNIVFVQEGPVVNAVGATDFLWQWGQFLDHDIGLTGGMDPPESANIVVPEDDRYFFTGPGMSFNRSLFDDDAEAGLPRQQINEVTAWIDASNVYGSSVARARALRSLDGTGELKTSPGDLLPFNVSGLPNAGGDSPHLFLAGDVRANEQVGLTALHILFVREHNRLVRDMAARHPDFSGDELYEKARQLVGAEMQVITYREFLPALLGPVALRPYRGYDRLVSAGIGNEFSTAAYRFGHSALSPTLLRLHADGSDAGPLPLRNAFFTPELLLPEGALASILRGLANQHCQQIDIQMVDDVRNFLFGAPPSAGFDLAALNIQRGRDHGLPSYNAARRQLGLTPATTFDDINEDPMITARLAAAYDSVEDIDLWVGGMAESHLPGGHLGELFAVLIVDQFEALRDGDRFWYQLTLTPDEQARVERTRLADIIRHNTRIGHELSDHVFQAGTVDRARARPMPPS